MNKKILLLKIPNFDLNQLNFEIDKGMMLLREYKHMQTKKKKEIVKKHRAKAKAMRSQHKSMH